MRKTVRKLALDVYSFKDQLAGKLNGLKRYRAAQIVLLHHIKPHEEEPFAEFLKWLANNYEVQPYSDVVEKIQTGKIDTAVAAISFDDGLKNNLRAAKILEEHGMNGCFFVCPDVVGQKDQNEVKKFCEQRLLYNYVDEFMDWDDLSQLKKNGHEIGNHSLGHLYMMDLGKDEFAEQVSVAKEKIAAELGEAKHFAWPYGRFFSFPT